MQSVKEIKENALSKPVLFVSSLSLQDGIANKTFESVLNTLKLSILKFLLLDKEEMVNKLTNVDGIGEIKEK